MTSLSTSPSAPPIVRRRAYLDNLKVVLVAGVITAHAFMSYGDIGSWAYREPSQVQPFLIIAALAVSLGSLFAMGLFFLIAGMLTPRALRRKGTGPFLRDRALRLGLPFLVYLVLYPLINFLGGGGEETLGAEFSLQLHRLDPGPLWFVLVLLIFSAGYALLRRARPAPEPRPMSAAFLVGLAGVVAAATFVVRLWFPIDSYQVFALHLWQWPQCLGLFVLGVTAAEHGWLDPVPVRMRRTAGFAALGAAAVTVVAFAFSQGSLDAFAGGLAWQAVLTACCEAVIAVGLSVWLLGTFQRHMDHSGPFARALGRAAFGAYVVQALVLVTIALAFHGLPWEPALKFLMVAPLAVAGSFALAWLLTRVPGLRRVL